MDFFGRAGGRITVIAIAASALSLSACRDTSGPVSRKAVMQQRLASSMVSHVSAKSRKIPDEYIVVFDESVDDVRGRAAALAQITRSNIRFTYTGAVKGFAAHMSASAAAALSEHPGVDFVEQDQEVSKSETSYAAAWGIDRIDQVSLPLNGQYSYSASGAGVRAYIIDTGIRRTHTQFGGAGAGAGCSVGGGVT